MTTIPIESEADIVSIRHEVRRLAKSQRFSIVQETKLVTAASELVRNALDHAGGGVARVEPVSSNGRTGVKVIVEDEGPGIPNVDEALRDGFSTGAGFGHGLGGAKRLADEFDLNSSPGQGTRVTIIRWK